MEKSIILLGFHFPEFEDELTSELEKLGINPIFEIRYTKTKISEYLAFHPECKTAILRERDEGMQFAAEDFAALVEENEELNVICVISSSHYRDLFVQTLYCAGITSAVFQSGKTGVKASEIAPFVLKKRSRREAKSYYGIKSIKEPYSTLSMESKRIYESALSSEDYGKDVLERFFVISDRLSDVQSTAFINGLSKDLISSLSEYEKFQSYVKSLQKSGFDVAIKIRQKRGERKALATPKRLEEVTEEADEKAYELPFDFGIELPKKEEEKAKKANKKIRKMPLFFAGGILVILLTLAIVFWIIKRPAKIVQDSPDIEPVTVFVEEVSDNSEIEAKIEPEMIQKEDFIPIEELLLKETPFSGQEVTQIIHSYPSERFLVVDERANKQIYYENGIAGEGIIAPSEEYFLSQSNGEYVFTTKMEDAANKGEGEENEKQ